MEREVTELGLVEAQVAAAKVVDDRDRVRPAEVPGEGAADVAVAAGDEDAQIESPGLAARLRPR